MPHLENNFVVRRESCVLRFGARKSSFVFCVLFSVFCFLSSASAKDYPSFGPISVRTQNPVYLQNLGLTPRQAGTLSEGVLEMRIDSAYSNLYEYGTDTPSNSSLDLDMEMWRTSLNTIYGVLPDMDIGIEIPIYHFSGGFLDSFIRKFHSIFGFPNGGREYVPDNRFSYNFTSGGATVMNFPPATLGLGDIVLSLKHQVAGEDDDRPDLSWFAELKFPTGRPSRGFGSGTPDFGFGAILEASYKRIHGHFNGAYFVLGGNQALSNYMQNYMFSYSVAGEITILPTWSGIIEVNGSTPVFTGANISAWNGVPVDLVVGFRGEETEVFRDTNLIWQFGFSEDVTSRGPSVDFTVFFSIGFRLNLFEKSHPSGDWLASVKR